MINIALTNDEACTLNGMLNYLKISTTEERTKGTIGNILKKLHDTGIFDTEDA
jgi:hypothetical protein